MKKEETKNELKLETEGCDKLTDEQMEQVSGGLSDDMANRVLRGDYGNGQERRRSLREAGFDYGDVKN